MEKENEMPHAFSPQDVSYSWRRSQQNVLASVEVPAIRGCLQAGLTALISKFSRTVALDCRYWWQLCKIELRGWCNISYFGGLRFHLIAIQVIRHLLSGCHDGTKWMPCLRARFHSAAIGRQIASAKRRPIAAVLHEEAMHGFYFAFHYVWVCSWHVTLWPSKAGARVSRYSDLRAH